jgi:AcrR family transcriptional regulator
MEQLPRGRHGLSREAIAHSQRQRLIAGFAEVLHEVGYPKTTLTMVVQRAGVSKSALYDHFAGKDDFFLAAFDACVERIRAHLLKACEGGADREWSLRVRDALAALLALLADDPALAAIVLVEGPQVGRRSYDRYAAATESFVSLLRTGAPVPEGGHAVPKETDEAVVGGIASLLSSRVLAGEAEQLEQLLPDVLEFALMPYVGAAEARRIISAG